MYIESDYLGWLFKKFVAFGNRSGVRSSLSLRFDCTVLRNRSRYADWMLTSVPAAWETASKGAIVAKPVAVTAFRTLSKNQKEELHRMVAMCRVL